MHNSRSARWSNTAGRRLEIAMLAGVEQAVSAWPSSIHDSFFANSKT
jgi:hypothetical protein